MSDLLRMRHAAFPAGVTRKSLLDWFNETRARSRALFEIVREDAYYDRPIALRNPIVFYEGHLAAFAVNTLIRAALRRPGIDGQFETLFARGIDPDSADAVRDPVDVWPARAQVLAYVAEADALVERALADAVLDDPGVPHLVNGEAVFTILEHEQMHQETLLYMFHNLEHAKKQQRAPISATRVPAGLARAPRRAEQVTIPAGVVTLGAERPAHFGWDNEFERTTVAVDAFRMDVDDVTNGEFLEFMDATGASAPHFWLSEGGAWRWRGMFEKTPLDPDAPVYVTLEQALAFAEWRGARLPTEAEYHRAAFGTPSGGEREYPWGVELPDPSRGNFDFGSWEPVRVASFEAGDSAWGVRDLVGNGWEWTSSVFAPLPGFRPMPSYPQYSADFFDSAHYVMKGASPATARHLVRRSLRNWFRPNYPYVYATFRCVRPA